MLNGVLTGYGQCGVVRIRLVVLIGEVIDFDAVVRFRVEVCE